MRRRAYEIVVAAMAESPAAGYQVAIGFPPAGARSLLELFSFVEEWLRDLAAVATGGAIVELQVNAQEGGHCMTLGGNRFVILSAGYLGSLFFGAGILLSSTRTRFSPVVAALPIGSTVHRSIALCIICRRKTKHEIDRS